MYKVTVLLTRPSADVSWLPLSENMKNTLTKHKNEGNLISENVSLSEDGLKKNYTSIWKDKKTYESWIFDDDLAYDRHQRRIYNVKNGCTISVIDLEEIN